jgi:hypothetical protein
MEESDLNRLMLLVRIQVATAANHVLSLAPAPSVDPLCRTVATEAVGEDMPVAQQVPLRA